MKEKRTYQQITSENIFLTYELLQNNKLISFPITEDSKRKVEAIVSNINNPYFGAQIYKTTEEKVVAFLYFLIKDHPFIDGNKRTASLVFEIVCDINNIKPNFKEFGLDELAVFIEKIKEEDHQKTIKNIADVLFK